jgi:hypothetical protein
MPVIKEISPYVRIVRKGTGMEPGHNVEIHEKVGNEWKKHWGTNEMSNNMASTEIKQKSMALAKKREDETKKKPPILSFRKEMEEHGYLTVPERQKLIDKGEYRGYLKKGGKVSTSKSSSKKNCW